jgi:cytochrome c-type biogenesis protein CcmF
VIAEAGHYALVLALALALIQSTLPILGARWRDPALMNVARSTALAQLLFVAASFAALVTLHVTFDFSIRAAASRWMRISGYAIRRDASFGCSSG